jgi:hypothetical protein
MTRNSLSSVKFGEHCLTLAESQCRTKIGRLMIRHALITRHDGERCTQFDQIVHQAFDELGFARNFHAMAGSRPSRRPAAVLALVRP